MKGFTGKVLVVDLSEKESFIEMIPESVYESVLSGVGLGAYYLCKHIPKGADPLGPDNILGFTAGLLTASGSVMTGRWMAVCKSPLTGGWGDSNCGGTLAPGIKMCGFDAIFFRGISKEPVYVYVDNKGAEIRDASAYWGLDAVEAEEHLMEDTWKKKKPVIATIGQGGEKCSLIAGISNDKGRYAARSGVGAVMGSKKLKALVLAGTKPVKVQDLEGIKDLNKTYAAKVRKSNTPSFMKGKHLTLLSRGMGMMKHGVPLDGIMTAMLLKKYGTVFNNYLAIFNGDAPFKNWGGSVKDYNKKFFQSLNPDKFLAREEQKYHCYSCIVGCGGVCNIKDLEGGKYPHTHKPEYETAQAFGGLILNKDTDSIFYINEYLNRVGLDSISAAGAVAFAIECYENGIITKEDTYGLDLSWGNSKAVIELVHKIGERAEGLGEILADGVKRASEKIGKDSKKYAVHAGGQELPMHDPKIDPMLATTYSADPTPGRHTTSGTTYYNTSALWSKVSWLPTLKKYPKSEEYIPSEEEAMKNIGYTSYKMLIDGVGACYYAMIMGVQNFQIFEYLNCATGWDKSPDEYMKIGKRIQTLRQYFNAKHGVDVNSFKMHERAVGAPPLKEGPNKGITLKIDEMVRLYRKCWGWDEKTGYPLDETIKELEIDKLFEQEGE